MNDLKVAFDLMDEDGDGKILKKDFMYLLTNMGLASIYVDKKSYTYKDFLSYVRDSTNFTNICKRLSSYKDNYISAKELVSIMSDKFDKPSIMFLLNNTMTEDYRIKIDGL